MAHKDSMRSTAGDGIPVATGSWSFTDKVAEVFDEHAKKSIPLYAEGHELISEISTFLLGRNAVCYDLGCSTGTLLRTLAEQNSEKSVEFIGVDVVQSMLTRAAERCRGFSNVRFECGDLLTSTFKPANLFIMYYTLQFVDPQDRLAVCHKILQSLETSGALILFEKTHSDSPVVEHIVNQLYEDYKIRRGHSPAEVIAKARGIRGILRPLRLEQNVAILKQAGFARITQVFYFLNFVGLLAQKE